MSKRSQIIRHLVFIMGIGAILVAFSQSGPGTGPLAQTQQPNGISGRVFCVAKAIENPCSVGGISVTRVGDDVVIARQTTGDNGTFQVPLSPGDYNVVPLDGSQQYPIVNKEPKRVRVTEQKFTEITIYYHDGRR